MSNLFVIETLAADLSPEEKAILAAKLGAGVTKAAARRLDAKETGKFLGISLPTLWRLCKSGQLPCLHIGRRLLFDERDLERFLTSCKKRRVAISQ